MKRFYESTKKGRKHTARKSKMIEVIVNDRLGRKVHVKCLEDDTVEDFKKVLSVQLGQTKITDDKEQDTQHADTQYRRIVLVKGQVTLKNHITLQDYEIHDGTYLELYYT